MLALQVYILTNTYKQIRCLKGLFFIKDTISESESEASIASLQDAATSVFFRKYII